MPTKLFFCFIFAVIFIGLSIVRIVKRNDDSLSKFGKENPFRR